MLLLSGICGLLVLALMPPQSRADEDEALTKICAENLCSSTEGCPLAKNSLLTTLPELNKEFNVSFKFRATAWQSTWQNVIHFTEGGNCCNVGARVPGFWVKDSGRLHPCFAVGDNGNYCTLTTKEYTLNTWHSVEISQSLKNDKYMYRVVVGGEDVIASAENTKPRTFYNVKVYAADNFYNPLEGSIRNLLVNTQCGVNGGWSDWSEWGPCICGNTTGTTRIQIRTRTCSKPEKKIGGKDCSGTSHDTRDCNLGGCPDINGIKQDYMAITHTHTHFDWNGLKQYQDAVCTMLPALLKADAIEENEIGVSSEVTDPTDKTHSYPWGLLTGDDIITTRVPEKWFRINGTVTKNVGQRAYTFARYRTTGMYAEAGTIVTIDIPQKLVGKLDVAIDLGPKDRIGKERAYAYQYRMEKSTQKIGSPWGGLISIFLEDIDATTAYGGDGMFDIRIQNAVQAPYFVYGENTNDEWNNSIKKQASPNAILLVPGQVQIYVPTYYLKRVTDIEKVVEGWKKSFDIADDLLGIPVGLRPGEEQMQLGPGGGGWRSGSCNSGVSWCGLGGPDSYGGPNWKFSDNNPCLYHEMGHGFCYPTLPSASSQMWAELVREYIERTKGNIPMSKELHKRDKFYLLFRMVSFHKFSKGKACGEASFSKHNKRSYKSDEWDNCWSYIYRLPLYDSGWDMFKKMMNLDAVATKSYNSRNERLVDLYCKATGKNLIPMFHFYNIQVSEAIEESCRKQPSPDMITELLDIANCLLNKDKDDMECSKLPGFPAHNGICTLSGPCNLNKDLNKSTKMINEFDLWGSHFSGYNPEEEKKNLIFSINGGYHNLQSRNTSMVKENCLRRAKEMFEWCDNTQEAQSVVTATFISNDGTSQTSLAGNPEGNCYKNRNIDGITGVTMSWRNALMTPYKCMKDCFNYYDEVHVGYYGVQFGKECWCGYGAAPPQKNKQFMSKCNMPCTGDKSKFCGGKWMLNIFPLPKELPPPEGNCYRMYSWMTPGGEHKTNSSLMTPDMCKKECSGSDYKYYAVQRASHCWCGKIAPLETKKLEMNNCNMPCKGDGSKFCGGKWLMNLYKL